MSHYSIGEVAQLSGVSLKTLHYYDSIGLLKPDKRGKSGYRKYSRSNLEQLQTILFYRELRFSLNEIKRILFEDNHSILHHLETQLELLTNEKERTNQLIQTLTKTINAMKNNQIVSDYELYEGFSKEEVDKISQEVELKYDPETVRESKLRTKKWDKNKWNEVKHLEMEINQKLAIYTVDQIECNDVQNLIEQHFHWVNQFYNCTLEMYLGLAELYKQDERFKNHYESIQEGLTEVLSSAIKVFVNTKKAELK